MAAAFALSGCDTTIHIETTGRLDPGFVCGNALSTGELVPDPEFGLAVVHPDGWRERVLWPSGFAGRLVGLRVALVDENGRVVAVEGDRLRLTGGGTQMGQFLVCSSDRIEVLGHDE